MATVKAGLGSITLDPNELNLGTIASGGLSAGGASIGAPTVGSATPVNLHLNYSINAGQGKYAWDFFGTGLIYSPPIPLPKTPAPDIVGGTLTAMADHVNNGPGSIEIVGFSVPAATFWRQVEANDNLGVLSSILAGDDTIIGSNQRTDADGDPIGDHLLGYAGNDTISGGAGFERLRGGPGNDFMDGGPDVDTAFYSGVSSTYKVVTYAGTTGVVANPSLSAEGVDKLVNVEQIAFADQTVSPPADNFSPLDYIASYADLRAALGVNAAAGFDHYLYAGAGEGRTVTFDGLEYIASYADLRAAFGANDAAGAAHFIGSGANEGRKVIFDGLEYIASYRDLIVALGPNRDAGTAHFITQGASEGRTVLFDPVAYELANPGIAAAFGADLVGATLHYITTGYADGHLFG